MLCKIHCDVATNVWRLPRFVIVPCTCVSFVVAGILVQIKTSSTQWVPVKMNWYFEHDLVLENCGVFWFLLHCWSLVHVCFYSSHTCKKLKFLSPKSWWVNASKKSNGECDIKNFRYLHRAYILYLWYVSSIQMGLDMITTVPCIHLFLQCDSSLSYSAEIWAKFN